MEIVRSVNRSWIYDSYASLYRPIHPGEMSRGNCPNTIFDYKACVSKSYLVTLILLKVMRVSGWLARTCYSGYGSGHVLTCSDAQNVQWWTKMCGDERVILQWWILGEGEKSKETRVFSVEVKKGHQIFWWMKRRNKEFSSWNLVKNNYEK